METIKRNPIVWKLTEQQKLWMKNNCCPICGLPKSEWKRRTDWRCCSFKCTNEFEKLVLVWQYWKRNVFLRDNYTCVKCGFEGREEKTIYPSDKEYYDREFKIFKILNEEEGILKVILGSSTNLIADHIIPISIGGEEYNLNNVQTLCEKCNKIKTRNDFKKIALYRNREKNQTKINLEQEMLQ
jgi:5-methylcytosine-specific restriction endonuclease McrA